MKFNCIILLMSIAFALNAQNLKVKNLEADRKKKLAEIEETNRLLNQTSNSKKNALLRLNLLSEQITSRKKIISLLNNEIETINKEISTTEKDIEALEAELEHKKANYAKSLQQMFLHKTQQNELLFIFSGKDFAQSYRRMRYLKEYSDWQKQQGTEISSKQSRLMEQKQMLDVNKKDKLVLVQDREQEEKKLKKEETVQQGEVKSLTDQEKELKKELDKKKQQAQELNRQIEKAIADEIARANAEAEKLRKANAEAEKAKKTNEIRDVPKAETEGGYAMTKQEQQLSSNFASNKGRLPFPLKGSCKIVGLFGEQRPEGLKHVTLSSNGIDIQTSIPNNEAKAVFEGEVSKVFVVPGYNNSVIVRHGNYLTVYCNLSEVYVKAKDKIKTGQAIGKIFTDYEDNNMTILHFELWKEKSKLNPIGWLNK